MQKTKTEICAAMATRQECQVGLSHGCITLTGSVNVACGWAYHLPWFIWKTLTCPMLKYSENACGPSTATTAAAAQGSNPTKHCRLEQLPDPAPNHWWALSSSKEIGGNGQMTELVAQYRVENTQRQILPGNFPGRSPHGLSRAVVLGGCGLSVGTTVMAPSLKRGQWENRFAYLLVHGCSFGLSFQKRGTC